MQVWPGHKLVCGPDRSSPYTPPSLTNEEATYLTSMADSCRSESNDADDQALWECWRKCLAMRPDSGKGKLTWGRTLEILASAKDGTYKKVNCDRFRSATCDLTLENPLPRSSSKPASNPKRCPTQIVLAR
jgi:hypothetical protein